VQLPEKYKENLNVSKLVANLTSFIAVLRFKQELLTPSFAMYNDAIDFWLASVLKTYLA
jgi:hypothetical protein